MKEKLMPVKEVKLRIFMCDMPESIPGCCVEWKDDPGTYMICVREGATAEEQEEIFLHEMKHIWHDDFHSDRTVHQIEIDRHKGERYGQRG